MTANMEPATLLPRFENICLPNIGNDPDKQARRNARGALAEAAYAA